MNQTLTEAIDYVSPSKELMRLGRVFYQRGWNLATSSNYSVLLQRDPLRVLMTTSGKHKGELAESDFTVIDDALKPVDMPAGDGQGLGPGRPSAESPLHIAFLKRGAGAVLHSHSVWATVLTERLFEQGFVEFKGFEMLKALDGVTTHDTSVRLPILENTQDMVALASDVGARLDDGSLKHGLLLKGHGLYAWGPTLSDARNRLEAIEFLLEVIGRIGDKS